MGTIHHSRQKSRKISRKSCSTFQPGGNRKTRGGDKMVENQIFFAIFFLKKYFLQVCYP